MIIQKCCMFNASISIAMCNMDRQFQMNRSVDELLKYKGSTVSNLWHQYYV